MVFMTLIVCFGCCCLAYLSLLEVIGFRMLASLIVVVFIVVIMLVLFLLCFALLIVNLGALFGFLGYWWVVIVFWG